MPRISCSVCAFFVQSGPGHGMTTRGKCRRFPPLVYYDAQSKQPSELWPTVNENWWCGEFRRPRAPASSEASGGSRKR